MNHDPFKINEAILDLWRDLKAGEEYIHNLEIRNASLVSERERIEPELEQRCRELNLSLAQQAIQLKQIGELKAEVERLSKPAVIGGYNISQYIRMANSETLEFDNGDIFAEMTLPERIKYIVESHARLKAEVERLRKAGDKLAGGRTHTFTIHGLLIPDPDVVAWNAAKESKQP